MIATNDSTIVTKELFNVASKESGATFLALLPGRDSLSVTSKSRDGTFTMPSPSLKELNVAYWRERQAISSANVAFLSAEKPPKRCQPS